MKKFIFSAIAMMAFSESSMANINQPIIENVNVQNHDNAIELSNDRTTVIDCYNFAEVSENFHYIISGNNDTSVGYQVFADAYDDCVSRLNCPSCIPT
ncbi:hypothetical protein [Flavobacterium sp. UBA6135]|uniref:hypothetical protein n=1 Tax=Flavobacterium sp. UBA6135 TaxID=1946553 RepID=UPI0025BA814B|nr:hypothetical protein [Flavobacterium sp. UBA6135]